jgi:hypothetical protein
MHACVRTYVHGEARVDEVLHEQEVAALEVAQVRARNLDLPRALRPLVRLDADEVEGELELGGARAPVRAEVDERGLQLPEEGGAALEHAQQVQRLVAVVLVYVERQLVDAVLDEPCRPAVVWCGVVWCGGGAFPMRGWSSSGLSWCNRPSHRSINARTVWNQDRFERVLVPVPPLIEYSGMIVVRNWHSFDQAEHDDDRVPRTDQAGHDHGARQATHCGGMRKDARGRGLSSSSSGTRMMPMRVWVGMVVSGIPALVMGWG